MDSSEGSTDRPVVRVIVRPEITQQEDGSWRASYPDEDWFVEGATKEEAIELLRARAQEETQSTDFKARFEQLVANPPPGVEVTHMTREEYEQRFSQMAKEFDQKDI